MNFLIPIDFSENALQAARFAFTHYPEANFTLLHIVSVRQAGATMVVDINRELKAHNEKQMAETLNGLKSEFPNLNMTAKVEVGLFSETIVEEIENTKADFLALGTKGASGLDEILLGSNAYLAIKNSPVPLFVINEAHQNQPPNRILFASDFEGDLSDETIAPLLGLKEKFNADVHVVHVAHAEDSTNVRVNINPTLDRAVNKFHVINAENIEDAIVDYAQSNDYDFIVLAPKHRGIIRNLFHQSVTKKISASAKTALIVLK